MSDRPTPTCQDDHHDDLAAYALGALTGEEARALEQHLDGCEACRSRLRWLQPAVDLMPASVPQVEAPEGLKKRLMDVVNEEAAAASAEAAPQAAPRPAPARTRRFRLPSFLPARPALAGLALLAVVAVVAAGVLTLGGGDDQLEGSYAANPVDASSKAGGLVRVESGAGSIEVHDLPPSTATSTYQVWIGHDGRVTPSSTFEIDDDGTGEASIPDVPPEADEILVTREPAGGSETPRGPQVLSADLS